MTTPAGSYLIDEQLYLSFCRMTFRRSLLRCIAMTALAIAIVLGVLFVFGFDATSLLSGALAGIVILVAFLAVQRFVLLNRQARKVYLESLSLQERVELAMDDGGFVIDQESGTLRGKWSAMAKWDETPEFLAVYPNRLMATLLPKRELSGETIDYCRQRLIASGLPNRGKLRK